MKKVISISEFVAPIRVENDACEVWASADANYDQAKSRLASEARQFSATFQRQQALAASWLPGTEAVNERVDFEEGNPAAKEIFQNWVKRVRRAVQQKGFAVATVSTE